MKQAIQCQVQGMTCGNCALSIQKYLESKGAADIVANASTGQVSFVTELDADELYRGIDQLGFQVVRDSAESGKAPASRIKPLLLICLAFWLPLISHMFLSWTWLHLPLIQFLLATPVMAIGWYHFGVSAFRSLKNGIPNMDVLVILGASAAYGYSLAGWFLHSQGAHQYLFFETTASIITLVLAGNYLEEYTVRSTTSALGELMKFRKTMARMVWKDSLGKETIQLVENNALRVNDIVQINTGDQVPADGIVLNGQATVDESMLTGESIPVEKDVDSLLTGGTTLQQGQVRMRVTAIGSGTTLSQIIELVNRAQAAKPPLQKLADRISAIFVPLVIALALIAFGINTMALNNSWQESLMRSIAMLVVACPCAMGLATPAAILVGIGRAARRGILVKGADTLEKLVRIRQAVFDKTGTLTTGQLEVDFWESSLPESTFKELVYSLEQYSSHPIAQALCKAWKTETARKWTDVLEVPGVGLQATDADGVRWQIGSYRLLGHEPEIHDFDIYVLRQNELIGKIRLQDQARPEAQQTIRQLQALGIQCILLSGDRAKKCEHLAAQIGIKQVYSQCLPQDKLRILDTLQQVAPTLMVGDGMNDAPALAKAYVGVSLSDASQVAMQSAGMILLQNRLSLLPEGMQLGRLTYRTIKENLFWAFAYNVLAIPVAAMGLLTPTWGAAMMGLSDVFLVLNSLKLRFLRIK